MENEENGSPESAHGQQPPTPAIVPEGNAPRGQNTTAKSDQQANKTKDQLDRALVGWTRMLAWFTGALVFAACLQFWAMWGQMDEMKAARESGDKTASGQMAVMRDQAKAMQDQVEQLALAQRGWLATSALKISLIHCCPVR